MTARQRSVRQQLLLHHLVVACCGEEQKNTCHVSFSVPHLRPETAVQTPAAQVRDQSLVWVVFDTGAQPQKGGSCSSRELWACDGQSWWASRQANYLKRE